MAVDSDFDDDNIHCRVCGRFCRETDSALWKTAYKCDHCSIKYYNRSEFNPEFKMGTHWE